MTSHIFEAISLNFQRVGPYARLSGGASLPVSALLIFSEVVILPSSLLMDLRAKYWQKRGVPVLVHEFVSMKLAAQFKQSYPFEIAPLASFPSLDLRRKEMSLSLKSGDLEALSSQLEKVIKKAHSLPHVNCMTRHMLESALRCANLARMHIEKAQQAGVKSPERFCVGLVRSHLMGLGFCRLLDRISFPLQNKGIPIVFQDVPPIEPLPRKY